MNFFLFDIRFRQVFLIFATIVQLQNWSVWSTSAVKNVCKTIECHLIAGYYQKNMDSKQEPCNNFYNFVCNNWGKSNPRPRTRNYWNVLVKMQDSVDDTLRKFIEGKEKLSEPYAVEAKKLYEMCIGMPSLNGRLEIVDLRKLITNMPMLSPNFVETKNNIPLLVDNHYIKLSGESAFYDIIPILKDKGKNLVTQLAPLESPYGLLIRKLEWGKRVGRNYAYDSYKTFLLDIVKSVGAENVKIPDEKLNQDIIDVIKFREDLRHIIAKTSYFSDKSMTIRKIQIWYNALVKLNENAETNFLEKIRTVYKNPKFRSYSLGVDSLINFNKDYLEQLVGLLESTPRRTILNHIHLYFIERNIALHDNMWAKLERSLVEHNGKSDIIRQEKERWKECIHSFQLRTLFSQLYIQKLFPKEWKKNVEQLIEEAKSLLVQQITESNWLDADTKKITTERVKKLLYSVGYINEAQAKSLSGNETISVLPIEVNAYYSSSYRYLFASASYLQWPIYAYDQQVPYVVNYGSLIASLGRHLYKAFDKEGLSRDEIGKKTMWSSDMLSKYDNQANCFRIQYEQYRGKELTKRNLKTSEIMVDTFAEDLGDVMGLKLAYNAYKKQLEKNKGVCPILVGLEEFDCDQLFFIAYANTMCDASSKTFQDALLQNGKYNLPAVRVNGAVANLKEFSYAFHCKASAPLHPKKTCDFWNISH